MADDVGVGVGAVVKGPNEGEEVSEGGDAGGDGGPVAGVGDDAQDVDVVEQAWQHGVGAVVGGDE